MTRARDLADSADKDIAGTLTLDGLSVDGGTIKLDGNYPTGTNNVALGDGALIDTTSGSNNTSVGADSPLGDNTTGSYNTVMGTAAMRFSTTGSNNSAFGYRALLLNSTGANNTAVGLNAAAANTTGSYNVAIGQQALTANTTASHITAVGYQAAFSTDGNGMGITALGSQVLYGNTTGHDNVAVGGYSAFTGVLPSMRFNTTGSANTAVGVGSMGLNTTGGNNVAIGRQSLYSNTTASNNTAVGYQAGYSNTTGTRMAAFGDGAADANTTGNDTVAFGRNALSSNTTGNGNTAVGTNALVLNTSDSYNTALGSFALESNTGGSNTCVGHEAGNLITTGSKNTIIGRYNGNQGGLDIRTSSNNIVLSDGDGTPRVLNDGSETRFGEVAYPTSTTTSQRFVVAIPNAWPGTVTSTCGSYTAAYNQYAFRNANGDVGYIQTNGSSTSFLTSSDYRLKENVVELTGATDRLKQLKPSRFNFIADPNTVVDGFLAHEVQDIVPEAIGGVKDAVDDDGNIKPQSIDQSKLVPLLVATIKELEARITALENA